MLKTDGGLLSCWRQIARKRGSIQRQLFDLLTYLMLMQFFYLSFMIFLYHFLQPKKPLLHGFFCLWMEPRFLTICRQQLSSSYLSEPSFFPVASSLVLPWNPHALQPFLCSVFGTLKNMPISHKKNQLIRSAEGSAGLLHQITNPTAWRGGAPNEEEEDARQLDR